MSLYTVITDAGEFQGELSIVPFMWELAMNGYAEDILLDEGVYSFVPLAAVSEHAEDEEDLFGAMLWSDSNGYVKSKWYKTAEEYDAARHAMIVIRLMEGGEEWSESFEELDTLR